MRTLLGIALIGMLAGCKVAAVSEDYRWKVKAPAQVSMAPQSRLHFVVEARAQGRLVAEVPYVWVVEWVGLHGVRHQGWSSREERILVKGDPGTAHLRILALDRYHEMVEVASASFEVTPEPPPAK